VREYKSKDQVFLAPANLDSSIYYFLSLFANECNEKIRTRLLLQMKLLSQTKRKYRFIHLHRKRAKPGSHGALFSTYTIYTIYIGLLVCLTAVRSKSLSSNNISKGSDDVLLSPRESGFTRFLFRLGLVTLHLLVISLSR